MVAESARLADLALHARRPREMGFQKKQDPWGALKGKPVRRRVDLVESAQYSATAVLRRRRPPSTVWQRVLVHQMNPLDARCQPLARGDHPFLLTYLRMFPTIAITRKSTVAIPSPRSTARALRLDTVCCPHLTRPQTLRATMSTRSSGGIKIDAAKPTRNATATHGHSEIVLRGLTLRALGIGDLNSFPT